MTGKRCDRRSGIVLVFVLVTITLLSLSLYSFSESMLAEYKVVRLNIQTSQQDQVAKSGIEVALSELSKRDVVSRSRFLYDSEKASGKIGQIDGLLASYDLVRINWESAPGDRKRFVSGLENESGKLNVNSLPLELSRANESRTRLTALPGIDLRIADSILDWMDEDDDPRSVGAERNYYSQQGYQPRQGPFESLDELLKVRGITAELLFGEDWNANGWLDACENDGDLSWPPDNQDGKLDRGLSAWITVDGGESTLNSQGFPKLNVNGDDLTEIYDALVPLVGQRGAQFVLAYRIDGPLDPVRAIAVDSESRRQRRLDSAEARLRYQLGVEDQSKRSIRNRKNSFRSGLDLSRPGSYKIEALTDLFGARVLVTIDTEQEILESPWDRNLQSLQSRLMQLEQVLTTTANPVRIDRINPNDAPREVLLTIPGLVESQIDLIFRTRRRILAGPAAARRFQSIAWLSTEAGLSFDQLRVVAPYLTVGGDLFHGLAFGKLDGVATQSVIDFQVDTLTKIPTVSRIHSLRPIPVHDE